MGECPAWLLWIAAFLLGFLTFVLNTMRRVSSGSKKMPPERKLELNMLRAARALRKLGRAKRLLTRSVAIQSLVQGQSKSAVERHLRNASSDATDAMEHLSAVLEEVSKLGCSIEIVRNIDHYIAIARSTHKDCRRVAHDRVVSDVDVVSLTKEQMNDLAQDCLEMLERAKTVTNKWVRETDQAAQVLAATTDPMIFRSGGTLRNPFKSESSVESSQNESAILLHWTKEDIDRTNRCLDAVYLTTRILRSSARYDVVEMVRVVSSALDSIDIALGEAELPLPKALVSEETLFEKPCSQESSGLLQNIYAHLVVVEKLLFSIEQDNVR